MIASAVVVVVIVTFTFPFFDDTQLANQIARVVFIGLLLDLVNLLLL